MLGKIKDDIKVAMQAGDKDRVTTLRGLLSAVQMAGIEKRSELTDDEIISVLQKESKKRNEAAEMYKTAGSQEHVAQELQEKEIIDAYLPEKIGEEQLTKIISETIDQTGASSVADMGKVIGAVRGKVGAQADGSDIARIVKEKLAS